MIYEGLSFFSQPSYNNYEISKHFYKEYKKKYIILRLDKN